jgi:cell division protein FtsL
LTKTHLILLIYCILIVCAASIVPWSYVRRNTRYEIEFAFLLADKTPKSIDYGIIALELVALSGLAGIAYLLRDYFEKLPVAFLWVPEKWQTPKSSPEDRVAAEEKQAANVYWDSYWNKEFIFLNWRLTRLQA